MLLFSRIRRYYDRIAAELRLGSLPTAHPEPDRTERPVLVPMEDVGAMTGHALSTALGLGEAEAIIACSDEHRARTLRDQWTHWNPGVPLRTPSSPHEARIRPIVDYTRKTLAQETRSVIVLIPIVESKHPSYRFLHDQWSLLLAEALREQAPGALVCLLPHKPPA
ncbi:hypothetical protein GCM10010182_12730 [Actinomadura cremea]|nr:hypothetical protein GCM10010182_12730 [Actinomadura cremea]